MFKEKALKKMSFSDHMLIGENSEKDRNVFRRAPVYDGSSNSRDGRLQSKDINLTQKAPDTLQLMKFFFKLP